MSAAEQMADELYGPHCDIGRLERDNKGMRELIYKMWLALENVGIVGGIYTYPDRNTNLDEEIDFRSAMRRFGIEVD